MVSLIKWPGLVVAGNSVTHEQALEICLRTASFPLSSNERDWDAQFHKVLFGDKFAVPIYDSSFDWRAFEEAGKYLNLLDIHYLCNSRITSSWIGGPQGWCNWDGVIGCSNYNIGKWPTAEDVLIEWGIIAKAFPFLNLRAQLLDEELSCFPSEEQNTAKPIIEFVISDGEVEIKEEDLKPLPISPPTMKVEEIFNRNERGVDLKTLIEARDIMKRK